ncbi:MAG: tetratricopeptide repeat protein [Acidobacteria bacterium]|nr:tetratricopeptide repeat protein [Acidobacteriota bacterium]MCA1637274.1 tetratricopeptide repeat protein [Acidobacteriota bacterium]
MEKISHYCQKCRAANEPGIASCWRCGTRLMLVVFPPSMRHEGGVVPSYYEDHLLERVSLLELRLAQVMEQLAMAYDFIRRETESFEKDHALLQSFFEAIQKLNPDLSEALSQNTLELLDEKRQQLVADNKQEQILREIFSHHAGSNIELFAHLVNEAVKLLHKGEEKQVFRTLERAALLSPKNVPLLVFIAETFFRADKFDSAKKNLETAFELAPHNTKVLLLLGVICADNAETENARKLLSVLINDPNKAFCVNYVWAMLAAFEENWTESLAAFKQALKSLETPEMHYLIGCAYFQLQNYKTALRYFQKTVSLEIKFADAWFMQSIIYKLLNNEENEKKAVKAAFESKEAGAQCLELLKRNKQPDFEIALPFAHFKKKEKHLLFNGSRRLTKFFREQISKSTD